MQKLDCNLLANRKAEPAALVNGKTSLADWKAAPIQRAAYGNVIQF